MSSSPTNNRLSVGSLLRTAIIAMLSIFLCEQAFSASLSAQLTSFCQKNYRRFHQTLSPKRFKVWEGEPAPEYSSESQNSFWLGGGGFGSVFRIVPKNKKPYIVKKYASATYAKNDSEDLAYLKRILADHPHVSVVKVLGFQSNKEVLLEDNRGALLSDLLINETPNNLSPAEKEGLEKRFQELRKFVDDYRLSHRSENPPFNGLKEDNILVDPVTLDFTIIDPK